MYVAAPIIAAKTYHKTPNITATKAPMPAAFAVREGYKNEEADHPIGFLR